MASLWHQYGIPLPRSKHLLAKVVLFLFHIGLFLVHAVLEHVDAPLAVV